MFKRILTCSLRVYILQDKRLFRSFGYNLRGHRARCRREYSPRGPRITAIPIICTEGLLDVGLYAGLVNGETLLEELFSQSKTYIRRAKSFSHSQKTTYGKIALQDSPDSELMVLDSFLQVTDRQIENYTGCIKKN